MVIGRSTRRKQQALTTRQLIFDTALALFQKKSYEKITIGDICRKAGISTGAFYHHFKSKDQIVLEEYLRLDEYCNEVYATLPQDILAMDRLILFSRITLKRFTEMGVQHLRAVYYNEIGPSKKKKFLADEKRPIFKILRQLVGDAQEKGQIRSDIDCTILVDFIVKINRGNIYDWILRGGGYDLEAAGIQLLTIFLHGATPHNHPTGC